MEILINKLSKRVVRKHKKTMKRLLQWFRELLSRVWRKIKQSRVFLAIVMLTIGITGTICFYEGRDLKSDYDQSMKIWEEHLVHKANAQRSGEEVKALSQAASNGIVETAPLSTEELIKKEFGEYYKIALAVAQAESGLKNQINLNTNGSKDCGLFQINSVHNPTKEQCENPEENIKLAKKIYDKSGFNAWVAYKSGSYLKFM